MDENEIQDLARAILGALKKAADGQADASNKAARSTLSASQAIQRLATAGNITEKELKEIAGALNISETQLDQFTKSVNSSKSAVVNLAAGLGKGNTSFSILSDSVRAAADVVGSLAGIIPVAGKAIGAFTGAVGKVAGFMIDRFDDAYGSFEKLSQVGAIGANGIKGLTDNFGKLNVPLETYTNLIVKNSQALAGLTGSTSRGADQIAAFAGAMKGSTEDALDGLDRDLRLLGFSSSEVSDTMVAYADIQRQLGDTQVMNQQKLTVGTLAYGKELDELARLTGKSREQAQQAQRQQLLDARFRAKLMQMQAQGQGDAARELQAAVTAQQLMGNQQMAQAIMSSATGFFVTPEAQAAVVSMNGFSDAVQGLASGAQNSEQFMINLQGMSKQAVDTFGPLTQAIGSSSKATALFVEQANYSTVAMGDIAKGLAQAREDILDQTRRPDAQTKALAGAKVNLEIAAATVSQLVLDSKAVAQMTNVMAEGIKDTVVWIKNQLQEGDPRRSQTNQQVATNLTGLEETAKAQLESGQLTAAEQEKTSQRLSEIKDLQAKNNQIAQDTQDAIKQGAGPLGIQVGKAVRADQEQRKVAEQTQNLINNTTNNTTGQTQTYNTTNIPAAPSLNTPAGAPVIPQDLVIPKTQEIPGMPKDDRTPWGVLKDFVSGQEITNQKLDDINRKLDKNNMIQSNK